MSSPTNLTVVVAMDRNRVIGKNGDIPWAGKLRADMDHFKEYTTGKIVAMGRKTYESIPERFRPLSNRENLIITRNRKIDFIGCGMIHDPKVLIRISSGREVCIIGGAEIYEYFLPFASRLIVTHVETEVEDGDTFFPEFVDEWEAGNLILHRPDNRNLFGFGISEYRRKVL